MANSVDLGPKLEAIVDELVARGRYNSKSEVLREGVRLVQEREKRLAALDAAIERSIEDSAAGRVRPASEVLARLETKYRKRAARSKSR